MVAGPSGDERRSAGLPSGRDLAQGLLEHLGRLAARDQVPAVDDHRRHRMDAELLPVALALAHLGARTRRTRGSRAARSTSRPASAGGAQQTSRAPGFSARAWYAVSSACLSFDCRRRRARGPPSAAGDARRTCSRCAAGRRTRSRPRRRARAARARLRASCSGGAPYLREMYSVASSPSGGIAGLSSNGSKCSSTGDRVAEPLERAVERPQADRAPRAGDVGDELDLHRVALCLRAARARPMSATAAIAARRAVQRRRRALRSPPARRRGAHL